MCRIQQHSALGGEYFQKKSKYNVQQVYMFTNLITISLIPIIHNFMMIENLIVIQESTLIVSCSLSIHFSANDLLKQSHVQGG